MKEVTVDLERCPGVAVCAAKACQTFLGVSFTNTLDRHGSGLISAENYAKHRDSIYRAVTGCPAGALEVQEYTG